MVYSPQKENTMPIPVEPSVLSTYVPVGAATAGYDITVQIPWKNCRLVHAYSNVVATLDTAAAPTVALELNAAGGTAIGTITAAAGDTPGTQDEIASIGTAGRGLNRDDTSKDAINLNAKSTNATGAFMVHMFFESEPLA